MRDAPDVVFVVSAYLSAYNARAFGVQDYIAQMMFNSPPGLSDAMDLAKMLACVEMIEPNPPTLLRRAQDRLFPAREGGVVSPPLRGKEETVSPPLCGKEDAVSPPLPGEGPGERFRIYRQTRIGLLSHPLDPEAARGHLAAATYLQMALRPHIVHVVGHTEAHHAATAEDVIAACKVARRAIENALRGAPDMILDRAVQARKQELIAEAQVTLEAIRRLAGPGIADPLTDPATLAAAVTSGILDAPHLRNNPYARGQIVTRIDERGACVAVDPANGHWLSEEKRIASLSPKLPKTAKCRNGFSEE
jgi:hypothetical protein